MWGSRISSTAVFTSITQVIGIVWAPHVTTSVEWPDGKEFSIGLGGVVWLDWSSHVGINTFFLCMFTPRLVNIRWCDESPWGTETRRQLNDDVFKQIFEKMNGAGTDGGSANDTHTFSVFSTDRNKDPSFHSSSVIFIRFNATQWVKPPYLKMLHFD